MSKFFSRFSKRKLSFTVAVLLIVAIGTPLLTRQFWVMDADSTTLSSDAQGFGFASDVSREQMKTLKTEISSTTTPEVPKINASDPNSTLLEGQALYDQYKTNHLKLLGQQITDTGFLKPSPGKNTAISFLSGATTQLSSMMQTVKSDSDKAALQSSVDKIEDTRKALVNSSDSSFNLQSTQTLADFLTEKSKTTTGALQANFSDIAEKFSFLSSGNTVTPADATALGAHNAAAEAGSAFSNNLGSKLQTAIPALVTSETANPQWGGLPFSRDQYNDFWTKGQNVLDQYSMGTMTPDLMTKLKNDLLTTAQTSLKIDANSVQKLGLTESLCGTLLYPQNTGYDIFLNNAEMAKFKDHTSGLSNYSSPQFSDLTTFTSNSFVVPAASRQLIYDAVYYKADPEGFKRILAQAGYTPEQIEKAAKKFRDKFPVIEAVVNDTATANGTQGDNTTTQPTVVAPAGSDIATTSETAYYDSMVDLALTSLSKADQAAAVALSKAVNDAINNNLNSSLFGREYISWLYARNAADLVGAYSNADRICNSSEDKKTIDQSEQLQKICSGVSSRLKDLDALASSIPGNYKSNFYQTKSLGTVSMDPRTGDMMYHSAVVCFDKTTGKPKIAGEMNFDPVQNQVSGNLTAAFGNNRVTLYSDAITGELYLEYSKETGSIAQIGSIVTVNTITVAKDGAVGGSFTMFHKLMNYNPNTKSVEVALIRKPQGTLWVSTDGTVRGEYSTKVSGSVSVGLIIDSKGNFTLPVNFTNASQGFTYGSLYLNQDGKISGQVDLGKTLGGKSASSVFIGFDSKGISSVGFPIGQAFGKPFSFSIGRDGGISFGGFIPVGPVPVPISLGQDQRGNITLSWPGGHWNLGHEDRPISAPTPKMKEDKSGYDGSLIWWHHGFKKGFKVVRVYNKVTIDSTEQKARGDLIFKKYNELLKRNPSISEFLNWYFYSGHECYDGERDDKMKSGSQGRLELLDFYMTGKLTKSPYSKVVPNSAKFPNVEEYKWIQAGNKPEDFAKRPTDLITLNPFDPAVIAKAQAQVNDPSQISSSQTGTGASLSLVTNAVNQGLQSDADYKATLQKIYDYFHPPKPGSSSNQSGFVEGSTNSNTNRSANSNTNR